LTSDKHYLSVHMNQPGAIIANLSKPKKRRMRGKVDINKLMLKRIQRVNSTRFTEPVINKLLDSLNERDQAEWLKQYVKPLPPEKPVPIEDRLTDAQLEHIYNLKTGNAK
jgi:hypothetical protein